MGAVYKAEDPGGELVAVKVVRSQVLYNMEKRERFLQCLLVASEIRHQGICPILEIGDDNDDFFIIMPFVRGKTLERYMGKTAVPLNHALDIGLSIVSTLKSIHEAGAAHRGLKPANIWIVDQEELRVILTDCCIARFTELGRRWKSRTHRMSMDFADTLIPLGALEYMSPEQVRGEPVDHRTDIFSLGVVLYEMLAGRYPFTAATSLSRISAILEADPAPLFPREGSLPRQLDLILRKSLAKDPRDRFQNIADLESELEHVRNASEDSLQVTIGSGLNRWFAGLFRRSFRN